MLILLKQQTFETDIQTVIKKKEEIILMNSRMARGQMTDTTLRRSAAANLNMIGAEIQLTAASSGVVPDDMFTVTQAVNNIGFGRFQIVLSFVVGLCWMADSMEMMILSILPLALQCEWGINHYRQAFLTTIVFIGKGTCKYLPHPLLTSTLII